MPQIVNLDASVSTRIFRVGSKCRRIGDSGVQSNGLSREKSEFSYPPTTVPGTGTTTATTATTSTTSTLLAASISATTPATATSTTSTTAIATAAS